MIYILIFALVISICLNIGFISGYNIQKRRADYLEDLHTASMRPDVNDTKYF